MCISGGSHMNFKATVKIVLNLHNLTSEWELNT